MGFVRLPEIRDYWSMEALFNFPYIRNIFSRDRFEDILHNLHLVNNIQRVHSDNLLFKIQLMINIVNKAFHQHW